MAQCGSEIAWPLDSLSTRVTSVVAKAAGYRLMTASFEWATTLEKGEKDPNFDGYFPEYYSKERAQACHLSHTGGADRIAFSTRPIAELSLHVCFKRSPAGLALRDAFDTALQTTDRAKVEADYAKLIRK